MRACVRRSGRGLAAVSVFTPRTLARRPQEIGARTRLEPHRWWQVEGVGPGFRPEQVLAMQIGATALMAPAQRASLYRRVLERIESIPGVERAGLIRDAFIGSSPERTLTTERDGEAVSARLQFRSDEISTGLFQALGTRLVDGRLFTPRDGPESPRVVIRKDTALN